MDMNLQSKKALITGASFGLGKAAALALASEGCGLYINSRNIDSLHQAAAEIKAKTGIIPVCIDADVATLEGIEKIQNQIAEIDILVSNAGGPPPGKFLSHTDSAWTESLELVLNSARRLTVLFLEGMVKRSYGRLIYITSVGVLQPIDDLVLSNTYRAGVTGMCKTISNTYAKFGITANCVCPGFTATERLKRLAKSRGEEMGKSPETIIESFTAKIPAGRIGRPEELAALITFLASEKAAYITGTSIPVDGGFVQSLI